MQESIIDNVKELAVKIKGTGTVDDVKADNIAAAIQAVIDCYEPAGAVGPTGAAGVSVTAIRLVTTGGAVTGGVATFSDATTASITVTGT